MSFNTWKLATYFLAAFIILGLGKFIGNVLDNGNQQPLPNNNSISSNKNTNFGISGISSDTHFANVEKSNSKLTSKNIPTIVQPLPNNKSQQITPSQNEQQLGIVTEDIAEKLLREKIQNESKGLIRLVSFSKTNGQEINIMGMPLYKVEYDGNIEFLEDCFWGNFTLILGHGYQWKGDFYIYQSRDPTIMGMQPPETHEIGKRGKNIKIKADLILEKTERGWREAKGY